MPTVRKSEAIEKLARVVEATTSDHLAEIYEEIYPAKTAPEVSGAAERDLAVSLAQHIRVGLEVEEMIDLWSVVFPADRHVRYDDERDLLSYNEGEPWYAER